MQLVATRIIITVFLSGFAASACKSDASKDARPAKSSAGDKRESNRPDAEGIDPPGWYIAGAKIMDLVSVLGADTSGLPDIKLAHQSCSFVEIAGVKTFNWMFSDVDHDETALPPAHQTLQITLETAAVPGSGTSWRFGKVSGESQRVSFDQQKSGGLSSYWSTLLAESDCVLDVTQQSTQAARKVQSESVDSVAYFFLGGELRCQRLPGDQSDPGRFLKFRAEVGCNGVLLDAKQTAAKEIRATNPSTKQEWVFVGYGNYAETERSCKALGASYVIPRPDDFAKAKEFLLQQPMVDAFTSAPIGSEFAWTSESYTTEDGEDRATFVQYATDSSGNHADLDTVVAKNKERYKGAGICFKP